MSQTMISIYRDNDDTTWKWKDYLLQWSNPNFEAPQNSVLNFFNKYRYNSELDLSYNN